MPNGRRQQDGQPRTNRMLDPARGNDGLFRFRRSAIRGPFPLMETAVQVQCATGP